MLRYLVAIVLLGFVASSSMAGDGEGAGAAAVGGSGSSVSTEHLAHVILEGDGPEQAFVAQYLKQADRATLLAVHKAIRKLAPASVDRARARGPEPDMKSASKEPLQLVNIEVRILEMNKGDTLLRDVTGESGRRASSDTFWVQYLDDVQLEVVLRAVEKSTRLAQVTAPRLTVYDRQRANVSLLNHLTIVEDVKSHRQRGVITHLSPVTGEVHEGVVLNMRPTLSKDGKYVTIELEGMVADIPKPIPSRTVRCGRSRLEVQMPHTDLHAFRTTVRIPDGGSMLLENAATPANSTKTRLVLLTARRLELTPAEFEEALPKDLPGKADPKKRGAPASEGK